MYPVAGDSERLGRELRSLQSFGLRDVVRMHPDDVIALKAWVLAKRLYERQLSTSYEDKFVHSYMAG